MAKFLSNSQPIAPAPIINNLEFFIALSKSLPITISNPLSLFFDNFLKGCNSYSFHFYIYSGKVWITYVNSPLKIALTGLNF
jgi:hypothetical protein